MSIQNSKNTIQKSRTIQYIIEVQNGMSVNANGQIGFAGTDVELGTTVANYFGQSYGTSESLSRSITVKAGMGTNMEHTVRQVEVWKIGVIIAPVDGSGSAPACINFVAGFIKSY